jgi:DNA-directed RNA polymerase specialized sigma24 family protein
LWFDELDVGAFYNSAWASLHEALSEGVSIDRPVGYLIVLTYRRGIDEARKAKPGKRATPDVIEKIGTSQDLATTLDDRASIASFQEAMSEVLTDKEHAVIVLCVFGGFTRPQVADMLGETYKRMERILDDARAKLRPLARSIERGEWCARYSSRLRALTLGMLDERGARYASTVAHLDRCPACRAELRGLRGVAA